MDNQAHLQKILEKLEENSRKQLLHSRIQSIFSVICALCCVVLLVSVLRFMPQLQLLAEHADAVLVNLETVTEVLSKLDLTQMIGNINSLVETSQAGVEEALEKLNEIDFDALNQAVKDLSDVVKPMADFAKRFSLGGLL